MYFLYKSGRWDIDKKNLLNVKCHCLVWVGAGAAGLSFEDMVQVREAAT